MRKKILGLFALLMILVLAFSMTGCGADKDKSTSKEKSVEREEWTFKDQADNEVTVKVPVKSMVVLQHHSIDILAQLGAQDKIVGVESKWESDLGSYIKDAFPEIESLPTPGDLKSLNVEEIAKLKPDVVIVASQANQDSVNKVKELGIPVIVVSLRSEGKQKEAQNPDLKDADKAYTYGCKWAIETLGKLTGKDDKAKELWQFCLESRKIVDKSLKDVSEKDKKTVFIANENNQTYGNDKYVGCMLERAGGVNVAAKDIQGYKPYTFEQLANWNPDVIIVQDRYKEVYDGIKKDSRYKSLKAVKDGNVILAPYWTKPWGNPDADSIALGELWLAHKLYPDKIDSKIVNKRANKFYKDFYGIEFKDKVK